MSGINKYERKYKKYFKKKEKKEDLVLPRDYPALLPLSLSMAWTVGVQLLCALTVSKTRSILDIQVPVELWQVYRGALKGNVSLLNA